MNAISNLDDPLSAISPMARDFLAREHGCFIDGRFVAARDGARRDVIDPANGRKISSMADGGAADIGDAVAAARRAFHDGRWSGLKPNERSRILWRIGELIDQHAVELAELEVLDEGSPYPVVKNFYVSLAAEHFRYFAGWANKIGGETLAVNMEGEWHAYTVREPVGVVGQILPWNVPLLMAAWKLAPALAAGCTVVLKPAEDTPLTALRLAELCREAGLPDGVLNIVTGDGKAGAALVDHADVDKIGFTGSTPTGKAIVRAAAANLKRVGLELGGKSPVFVFPDADIESAIPGVAQAVFLNSGQACTAGSRLYIHEDVFDRVVEGVSTYAQSLKLGHGLQEGTDLGPLISARQHARVTGLLQGGLDQGARLVTGGAVDGEGFFVRPTVLTGVSRDMTVYKEEIFGPVISAMKMSSDNIDDLAREANNSTYGLAASIWTNDLRRAHKLAHRIRAGIVWINNHNQSDANMPWGGFKESGWGREMGRPAVDMYTEIKSVAAYLG